MSPPPFPGLAVNGGPPPRMTLGGASFAFLRELLRESTSIHLLDDQRYLVEGRLSPLAAAEGSTSLDALVDRIRTPDSGELRRRIVEALLTNETSFFRDEHPWETLRTNLLPELFRSRPRDGRIDIWCAACSSGQEPYSLVLLIREYLAQASRHHVISVRATDISQTMLDRARLGQFNHTEIARGLPVRLRDRYFRRDGDRWEIDASLREAVTFERLNLAGSWPSGPRFDLVLLRNVLIYFSTPARARILRRLAEVIAPGGYLMLGSSEVSAVDDSLGFERVVVGRTALHRKT